MKKEILFLVALFGSVAITGNAMAEETIIATEANDETQISSSLTTEITNIEAVNTQTARDASDSARVMVEIRDKGTGIPEHIYSRYDEDDNLIMRLSVRADDTIDAYELYRYDGANTYQLSYVDDGTLDEAVCLVRDENGNIVEEYQESEYICSLKKYTYDNNLLQSVVDLSMDQEGNITGADHLTEYTYENEKIINETSYLILRGLKNELSNIEYIYDGDLLVKKQGEYTVTEYTYENGNLASEQFRDEELNTSESCEYKYDPSGKLIEEIYQYETEEVAITYEMEYIYEDDVQDTNNKNATNINLEIEFPEYTISEEEIKNIREKMDILEAVELAEVVTEEIVETNPEDIETIDADRELIQRVQEKLNENGFDCGKADGLMGSRTANAINSYQARNGLTTTGTINQELLNHLGL